MKILSSIAGAIVGLIIAAAIIFGVTKFVEFINSPEQNRGYCVKIETVDVYKANAGWTEVTYEKSTVDRCVEWENYKP